MSLTDVQKIKRDIHEKLSRVETVEPEPTSVEEITREDNISENKFENSTDPAGDESSNESTSELETNPQIYYYPNPINPRYKNKYTLADEYIALCKSRNKQPITIGELTKMKVKDLGDLVRTMNRSLPAPPNLVEKKSLSVAQGFANLNLMLAMSLERMIHDTRYCADGLTVNMKKNEEDLKLIGELIYQDAPEVMDYVANPYMQLAGIWGMNVATAITENKKKN